MFMSTTSPPQSFASGVSISYRKMYLHSEGFAGRFLRVYAKNGHIGPVASLLP